MSNSQSHSCKLTLFVFVILFCQLFIPLVGASSEWKEDGWLSADWYTRDGRIAAGDELGCQGMPTLNLEFMPNLSASECKKYLTERTNASRWSSEPLSFGVDMSENPNFDSSDHAALFAAGFTVHGLSTNYKNTAWHDANDVPEYNSDWWNLGYSGSIEQSVSSLDKIQDLAKQGAMVNLHWQAQIADLKVRTNGVLVEWLESENLWYTTWGEAYSYDYHRNYDSFDLFYGDADLCLKTLNIGLHVVYTPFARLLHEGSSTIKKNSKTFFAIENHFSFIKKWPHLKQGDPFYNRNLGWDYSIAKLEHQMGSIIS